MFNGYNETPLISYTDFDQERGKKHHNVPKWSYGNANAMQQPQPSNHQPEFWPPKSSFIGLPNVVPISSKCSCAECYSASENQGFQGDAARHRSWFSRTFPVPLNGTNESTKLAGYHHWENVNASNGSSCSVENSGIASQYIPDSGEKAPFYRPYINARSAESHQPGVITSMKNVDLAGKDDTVKPSNEIITSPSGQEILLLGQNNGKQSTAYDNHAYPSARDLGKKETESAYGVNYCDQSDKYSSADSCRQQNNVASYPLDQTISRHPIVEPYIKAVPSNSIQNRVPSTGHRNIKDAIPQSYIDQSYNDTGKVVCLSSSQVNGDKINRNIYQSAAKEIGSEANGQLNHLPPSVHPEYSEYGLAKDYSTQCNSNSETESHKLQYLSKNSDFVTRNMFGDVLKKNAQNYILDAKKDCMVNQNMQEQYYNSIARSNHLAAKYWEAGNSKVSSCGIFYPKDYNGPESLHKVDVKFGMNESSRENLDCYQRNDGMIKKDNSGPYARLHRSTANPTDPSNCRYQEKDYNTFPYQAAYRSCRRPEYPYSKCNSQSHYEYPHGVSGFQRNEVPSGANQYNMISYQHPQPFTGIDQYVPHVNNFMYESPCQQPGVPTKSFPQTFYDGNAHATSLMRMDQQMQQHYQREAAVNRSMNENSFRKTSYLEQIRNEDLSRTGNSKISPLRLLRKKKFLHPREETVAEPAPLPISASEGAPALDVRKFWATWADEEEENVTPTQMVVLDCQNIDPEQAELLRLYDSNQIRTVQFDEGNIVTIKDPSGDKIAEEQEVELGNSVMQTKDNHDEKPKIEVRDDAKPSGEISAADESENVTKCKNLVNDNAASSESPVSSSPRVNNEPMNSSLGMPVIVDPGSLKLKESKPSSKANKKGKFKEDKPKKSMRGKEADEKTRIDKWTEKKFDFLKRAEESKAAEMIRTEEEKKRIFEKKIFASQVAPKEAKTAVNTDHNHDPHLPNLVKVDFETKTDEKTDPTAEKAELDVSSPILETEEQKESPERKESTYDSLDDSQSGDMPVLSELPTSEYRKNKFLDYSEPGISFGSNSLLSSILHNKPREVSSLEYRQKSRSQSRENSPVLNATSFEDEPVVTVTKTEIGSENERKTSDIDDLLTKISEINFSSPKEDDVASSEAVGGRTGNPAKAKKYKKLSRKNKRPSHVENVKRTGQLPSDDIPTSKPTIKFSIQKSHDLKISFKVMNDSKYENPTEDVEKERDAKETFKADSSQETENESTTSKIKNNSNKCRTAKHKKLRADKPESMKTPVLKIKKSRFMMKDRVREDSVERELGQTFSNQSLESPKSARLNADDFQVHETVDSAKIKLTFKRHKSCIEKESRDKGEKFASTSDDAEIGSDKDLEDTTHQNGLVKRRKSTRRPKSPQSHKTDSMTSQSYQEGEAETVSYQSLSSEENAEACPDSCLKAPQSRIEEPTSEWKSGSGDENEDDENAEASSEEVPAESTTQEVPFHNSPEFFADFSETRSNCGDSDLPCEEPCPILSPTESEMQDPLEITEEAVEEKSPSCETLNEEDGVNCDVVYHPEEVAETKLPDETFPVDVEAKVGLPIEKSEERKKSCSSEVDGDCDESRTPMSLFDSERSSRNDKFEDENEAETTLNAEGQVERLSEDSDICLKHKDNDTEVATEHCATEEEIEAINLSCCNGTEKENALADDGQIRQEEQFEEESCSLQKEDLPSSPDLQEEEKADNDTNVDNCESTDMLEWNDEEHNDVDCVRETSLVTVNSAVEEEPELTVDENCKIMHIPDTLSSEKNSECDSLAQEPAKESIEDDDHSANYSLVESQLESLFFEPPQENEVKEKDCDALLKVPSNRVYVITENSSIEKSSDPEISQSEKVEPVLGEDEKSKDCQGNDAEVAYSPDSFIDDSVPETDVNQNHVTDLDVDEILSPNVEVSTTNDRQDCLHVDGNGSTTPNDAQITTGSTDIVSDVAKDDFTDTTSIIPELSRDNENDLKGKIDMHNAEELVGEKYDALELGETEDIRNGDHGKPDETSELSQTPQMENLESPIQPAGFDETSNVLTVLNMDQSNEVGESNCCLSKPRDEATTCRELNNDNNDEAVEENMSQMFMDMDVSSIPLPGEKINIDFRRTPAEKQEVNENLTIVKRSLDVDSLDESHISRPTKKTFFSPKKLVRSVSLTYETTMQPKFSKSSSVPREVLFNFEDNPAEVSVNEGEFDIPVFEIPLPSGPAPKESCFHVENFSRSPTSAQDLKSIANENVKSLPDRSTDSVKELQEELSVKITEQESAVNSPTLSEISSLSFMSYIENCTSPFVLSGFQKFRNPSPPCDEENLYRRKNGKFFDIVKKHPRVEVLQKSIDLRNPSPPSLSFSSDSPSSLVSKTESEDFYGSKKSDDSEKSMETPSNNGSSSPISLSRLVTSPEKLTPETACVRSSSLESFETNSSCENENAKTFENDRVRTPSPLRPEKKEFYLKSSEETTEVTLEEQTDVQEQAGKSPSKVTDLRSPDKEQMQLRNSLLNETADVSGADILEPEEKFVEGDIERSDAITPADIMFEDNIFVTDEFYACEGITSDEPMTDVLPNVDEIEEEKVSDDKFRDVMQNCLENAKRFLNVGNLKLFSCSVEDLLGIDGRTSHEHPVINECDANINTTESANHFSRDVLLTSCGESGNEELVLTEHFTPLELSIDFVPSFGSDASHNLCPEILPVDNWPYLEEEVPSSPVKARTDDSVPLSPPLCTNPSPENPVSLFNPLTNLPESQNIIPAYLSDKTFFYQNLSAALQDLQSNNGRLTRSKARRMSTVVPDFMTEQANAALRKFCRRKSMVAERQVNGSSVRMPLKRRKTIDGVTGNTITRRKVFEQDESDLNLDRIKNDENKEHSLNADESLKCRLSLRRLTAREEENGKFLLKKFYDSMEESRSKSELFLNSNTESRDVSVPCGKRKLSEIEKDECSFKAKLRENYSRRCSRDSGKGGSESGVSKRSVSSGDSDPCSPKTKEELTKRKSGTNNGYLSPVWQPKVMLFRISDTKIKDVASPPKDEIVLSSNKQKRILVDHPAPPQGDLKITGQVESSMDKLTETHNKKHRTDTTRKTESCHTHSKSNKLESNGASEKKTSDVKQTTLFDETVANKNVGLKIDRHKSQTDCEAIPKKVSEESGNKSNTDNDRLSKVEPTANEESWKRKSSTCSSEDVAATANALKAADPRKRKKPRFRNLHTKRKRVPDTNDLAKEVDSTAQNRNLVDTDSDSDEIELPKQESMYNRPKSTNQVDTNQPVADDARKKNSRTEADLAKRISNSSSVSVKRKDTERGKELSQLIKTPRSSSSSLSKTETKPVDSGRKSDGDSAKSVKSSSAESSSKKESLKSGSSQDHHRNSRKNSEDRRKRERQASQSKEKSRHEHENRQREEKDKILSKEIHAAQNSEKQENITKSSGHGKITKHHRRDDPRRSNSEKSYADEKMKKSKGKEDSSQVSSWVCEVCGFKDITQRAVHIQSHPFHCQSCHLAFKTEPYFVSHLTKKHKDIRNQHHCLLCELSFDSEDDYNQHLASREHRHLEWVEKNTINTLFTLLTGQSCPVLSPVEVKPEWLPNQAGTVHFYHQATPLSLALQYLKMRHDTSSSATTPAPHPK